MSSIPLAITAGQSSLQQRYGFREPLWWLLLMNNFDTPDLPEPSVERAPVPMQRGRASWQQTTGLRAHQPGDEERLKTPHPCPAIRRGLALPSAAMAGGASSHMVDGIGIREGLGIYTAGHMCGVYVLAEQGSAIGGGVQRP